MPATTRGRVRRRSGRQRLAREWGDRALEVRAQLQLGFAMMAAGNYAEAAAAMREVVGAIRGDASLTGHYGLDAAVNSLASSYAARTLAELGEFEDAATAAVEGARVAAEWDRPFSYIFAEIALGYVALCRGAWAEAMPHCERAREPLPHRRGYLMAPVALALLGAAQLQARLPPM